MNALRTVVGAGVLVLALLLLAAWIASSLDFPRPFWDSNPFGLVFYPTLGGAKAAWEQRRRGPIRIVAAGLGGIATVLALLIGFNVLVNALHPWARDQAWLDTAMFFLLVVGGVALLARHVVTQTNPRRRHVSLAQGAVIGMIMLGLWLGTRWWEGTSGFGLLLALVGTFAVYFLEKERTRADKADVPVAGAGS